MFQCHSPHGWTAFDQPQKFPYPRISERRRQSSRYSLFQAILQRICTSRYKKMIKISMIKHILGINRDIGSPNRVGSPGYQCWWEVSSLWPEPTQSSMTNLSRGAYKTNLLTIWPKLGSAQLSSGHVQRYTCSAKYQDVQQIDNWNTWVTFHFTPWQEF